ncbi:hypothetical protein, partial [Staphylococcus aureus]|uniref:hypothetical protein n=1 Tax=Staphylococcus aureus TaxID=1280 RepID=UPI001C9303A4
LQSINNAVHNADLDHPLTQPKPPIHPIQVHPTLKPKPNQPIQLKPQHTKQSIHQTHHLTPQQKTQPLPIIKQITHQPKQPITDPTTTAQ